MGFRPLSLAIVALGIVVACVEEGPHTVVGETTQHVVIDGAEALTGADLGDKELVWTFDDGPGPTAVTGALSTLLKNEGIHAVFFVNGACIADPTAEGLPNGPNERGCAISRPTGAATLEQLVADGHLVANHTTTHRPLTSLGEDDIVDDVMFTHDLIRRHVPWNRWLFRGPEGAWDGRVADVFKDHSTLRKYTGPIYWTIGGGPTTATRAADWQCWPPPMTLTTKQCGDRYLTEIRAIRKGIVLLHDPYPEQNRSGRNTVDMVKYILDELKKEGGWTYKSIEDVPSIAELMPKCDPACAHGCSGPSASECLAPACAEGQYDSGEGCQTCRVCPLGSKTTAACTPTADTTCTKCPRGETTTTRGATECEPCPDGEDDCTDHTNPDSQDPSKKPREDAGEAGAEGGCSSSGAGGGGAGGLAALALALLGRRRRRP